MEIGTANQSKIDQKHTLLYVGQFT
jgi:hypothetical protein